MKSAPQRVWLVVMLAALVTAIPSPRVAATELMEDDLTTLVKLGIAEQAIVEKIEADGIGFDADEAMLGRLKAAGASVAVLKAVQDAAAKASPPEQAVTYEDIIKLLELRIGEAAILERLEKSPTVFTLSAEQVAELKRAGASEKLIGALQGTRPATPQAAELITDIAIVLDCSASMQQATGDGETKMTVAKRVVTDLVQRIPEGLNVAFIVYGHEVFGGANDPRNCQAVKVVRPIGPLDAAGKSALTRVIEGLQPTGATPIALSLKTAGQELVKNNAYCGLVLITDGLETCNGNPQGEAAALAANLKITFGVNVVGFGVTPQESAFLKRIADAGKGEYYDADSAAKLADSIGAIVQRLDEAAEPAPAVVAARRAIKVLPPEKLKLPALKELALVEAGRVGPDVPSNYDPEADGKQYGEEIRLPSTKEYDLLWIPAEGKYVRLVQKLSIQERKLVEVRPDEYLGVVRVHGGGLPQPEMIAITEVDRFGPNVPSNFRPVQFSSAYGKDMVVPAGTYDVWLKPADGGRSFKLEEKLAVAAGQVVEIGGSGERGVGGRRAVKVLPPKVKLPPLKGIAVVEAGDFGPNVPSNYDPVVVGSGYQQEMPLPSAAEFDVLWIPESGKHVRMVAGLSIADRRVVEIRPEEHLGLFRIGGAGLPKPKLVALTKVGDFGPNTPSNFDPVQVATEYGVDMVVPAGKYDLWLQAADGNVEKLEEELDVPAGKALVLD